MKMKLMTPEAIKEIESLIPDHEEALMRWGAQMYREGIVKGAMVNWKTKFQLSYCSDWNLLLQGYWVELTSPNIPAWY